MCLKTQPPQIPLNIRSDLEMRKLLFTTIVLIVLGTAWMLYLQWENKRFAANLLKVPSNTNIEQPIDTITQGFTVENENSDSPAEANVSQESPTMDEGPLPDPTVRPPHHSNSHLQNRGSTLRHQQKLEVRDQSKKEDRDIEAKDESPSSSVKDLSVEEIIENNRRFLINQHGDIPEIDKYLELNAPFFQQIKDGTTRIVVEMTPEDSLENSRLTAILYPNEANKKAYQDELKRMRELGVIK